MLAQIRNGGLAALLLTVALTMNSTTAQAEEPAPENPKLGLNFTELPSSIRELRFAFECPDALEIEIRWIAQNVGDVAPANTLLGSVKVITRGPLNLARLSRPADGWPLGLYRLELWHNDSLMHTVYYVIEDLDAR